MKRASRSETAACPSLVRLMSHPFAVLRHVSSNVTLEQLHRRVADGRTFALLVGNSKAIWAPFIAACVSHNELLQDPNPFDTYIERSVEAVCSDALPG